MGYVLKGKAKIFNFNESSKLVMERSEHVYSTHKKITDTFPEHAWEGQRCFIIGGGESIKDFDFKRLKNEHVIGINRSFEVCDSELLYLMDIKFHNEVTKGAMDEFSKDEIYEKWKNFKGAKVLLCPVSPQALDESVHMVRRIEKKNYISLSIDEGIYGGSNSGFGALMLAIAMGASPIYLLGYDMRVEKQTHWHSGYPKQTYYDQRQKSIRFRESFFEMASAIQGLGFKVVNLFQDSGMNCFEFGDVDDILPKCET